MHTEPQRTLSGTALITGASSGIGATYADRLARQGHDLILVARDQERLNALAGRLAQETGVRVDVLVADLTHDEDLARVVTRLQTDASIGVLINNAGMAVAGKLVEADIAQIDAMLRLNMLAPTHLAAAAARAFAARGRGAIINIGSVTALMPETFSGTYGGSKAYLLNLTQSMHAELGATGVAVQVVLPGVTRTEIWDRSGIGMSKLPPHIIMEVGDMVDAALTGFELGEIVTIPSLPEAEDWEALTRVRLDLVPRLSLSQPAPRYRAAMPVA